MIDMPSFLQVVWIDFQYLPRSSSDREGGRFNSNSANLGETPLVATSEATALTLNQADSPGPREGMNETGSVLAIITRPLPSLKTEQSIPDLGPWTTSEFQAPVC